MTNEDWKDIHNSFIAVQVAVALGLKLWPHVVITTIANETAKLEDGSLFDPCNNWGDAGPIIQNYGIGLFKHWDDTDDGVAWTATTDLDLSWNGGSAHNPSKGHEFTDKNPLRAAMIVFLKMKEATK